MMELSEARIAMFTEAITEDQVFVGGIALKEGVELWKDFVSASLGANKESVLQNMQGFGDLCENGFNRKEWNMKQRNQVDVENFFNMILQVVKGEAYKQLSPEEQKDLKVMYQELGLPIDETEWSEADLEEIGKYRWCEEKDEAYRLIYKLYFAVLNEKVSIDQLRRGQYVDMLDCLFSMYIDCVARYKDEIRASFEQLVECVDWLKYCNRIVTDRQRISYMEEYVMVDWREEARAPISTAELPETIDVVTLCGGAGVGKSTALLYLQYTACEKYMAGDTNVKIPIVIRLSNVCGEERKSVTRLLCEELSIEEVALGEVLRKAPIRLFLDGYNELPDDQIRRAVRSEINELIAGYRIPIFVTDRTGDTGIGTGDLGCTLRRYRLANLNEAQVRSYFEKKTSKDLAARTRIEEALGDSISWVLTDATIRPYQLEVIVKMAKNGDELVRRDAIMTYHLNALFEREKTQRDPREVNRLRAWLRKIAMEMSNHRRDEAPKSVIDRLTTEDEYRDNYSWASALMIIYSDGDSIRFVSEEYCNYFLTYITYEGTEKSQEFI